MEFISYYQEARAVDWAAWLSAFGTIAAVWVAVFWTPFVDWLNRPKICLELENKRPFCFFVEQRFRSEVPSRQDTGSSNNYIFIDQTGFGNNQSCGEEFFCQNDDVMLGDALFVRLKVVNNGVKLPAENVEVYLHSIKKVSSDDPPVEIGMNLLWSNVGKMFFSHIPANGGEKYCDIGFITDPDFRANDSRYGEKGRGKGKYTFGQPAFCFNVAHPLSEGRHIVGPGAYKASITVFAMGAEPVKAVIELEFSKWSPIESSVLTQCSITTYPNCFSMKDKFVCLLREIFPPGLNGYC